MGPTGRRGVPAAAADGAPGQAWHTAAQWRASLAQGQPAVWWRWSQFLPLWQRSWCCAWLLALAATAPPAQAAACPGPALRFVPLATGVWLVPAADGESDTINRGQVSNLVLVHQAPRWWALGSGPSPAFGRALACQLRRRLGGVVTDVISPWARPELVLGVGGLAGPAWAVGGPPPRGVHPPAPLPPAVLPRHWAHAAVAQAMAEQCPHCVDRLHQRLGPAAADLGDNPIHLPVHLLAIFCDCIIGRGAA